MTTPRSVSCPRIEARFEGLLIYNSFAYIRFPRERRYVYGAGSRVTKGRRVSSQTTAHQYSRKVAHLGRGFFSCFGSQFG